MIRHALWLLLAVPAAAQEPLLEVRKADDTSLLTVHEDAALLLRGALGEGTIPASGEGIRLMWHPAKAAFRAGGVSESQWDEENVGEYSAAFGNNNLVKGERSMAAGSANEVTGSHAFAAGFGLQVTGTASVALGDRAAAAGAASFAAGLSAAASGTGAVALGRATEASGEASTAAGFESRAVGQYSTATGYKTFAGGPQSTVMGSYAGTFGEGGFAYGDASVTTINLTATTNEFAVRASGGFRFRTNAGLVTGCNLPANSGTFECTSSRLAKTGFEDLDADSVLARLATIPIRRWRYLETETPHVGPTAEDFHAAFGLGSGPTTIATVDADGITMLAVQALIRRTDQLRDENAQLRAEVAALQAERTRATFDVVPEGP